ncbi:hypothetical protein BGZ63DRAFT_406322 [Mariannaea sp. PMI_226]|nr:hypothetical protein BGZ63DRAFT_406322 [Mariannaea sp. PMI_226]
MTLFQCAGCSESIPSHKVRLHCEVCYDYSLCANCAILGVVTPPHSKNHDTTLHRESGLASVQSSPVSARGPPRLMQAWSTLFDMDTLEARPSGIDLLSAIFDCVAEKTGIMTPEAYSSLLDLVDCPVEDNIWKDTLESAKGPDKEKQAIDMLRQYFDAFSIDYDLYDVAIGGEGDESDTYQAPCLTRKGFIKLWKADCLHNPERACDEANLILQHYQPPIWRDRGEVPRSVFPQERMSYEDQEAFYSARKKAKRVSKLPSPPRASPPQRRPSLGLSTWTDTLAYTRPRQIVPDRELWAQSIQAAKEAKEAFEIQRARQELEALRVRNERDLADLRRSNEIEYIRAQQEMHMDSMRGIERTRSLINGVGEGQEYVIEPYYR